MNDSSDSYDTPLAARSRMAESERSPAGALPAPAWYPDPDAPLVQLRYWDGGMWTKNRRPLTTPTSTAVPLPPPSARIPTGGGRSMPLTLAGILFIVAGLGGTIAAAVLVATASPVMSDPIMAGVTLLVLAGSSLGFYLGLGAAYVVLWRAGFPHRSRVMTIVTIGIAVLYPVILLISFAQGFTGAPWLTSLLLVIALICGLLTLIFTISAARNRVLPRGFRIVPVVQIVLVVICNIVVRTGGPDLSGLVCLGVGVAFVVLASNARAALEAASVATEEARTGQPAPPPMPPAP
ncbi:MAG: DUF2510 domain-containing protein [Microbacterium sp.]